MRRPRAIRGKAKEFEEERGLQTLYLVFGRDGVVRTWETNLGPAVMLDCDHPVYLPLRRLLVALERTYPLPPLRPVLRGAQASAPASVGRGPLRPVPRHHSDVDPDQRRGPRLDLRGPVLRLIAEHDRFNIKRSMRRLEDEGVLQGDRARGPGFKVRVVTITDGSRQGGTRGGATGLRQGLARHGDWSPACVREDRP